MATRSPTTAGLRAAMSRRLRSARRRLGLWGALALTASGLTPQSARALEQWQIDVGYDKLVAALGGAVPTGNGVAISQVEAGSSGSYLPDVTGSEFTAGSDPLGQAVTVTPASGIGSPPLPHATDTVGRYYYGNTFGLARGANQVTVYEANDWIQNVLRYASNLEPAAQNFRVQNHSWVTTTQNPSVDVPILQRFDYAVEVNDMTAVVGISNNINSPQPDLLGHSYNGLAVGLTNSMHSRGATTTNYHAGRVKPDIVAPATVTSSATAMVSSAAALLHGPVAGTGAAHNETMKAILMAGATKQEFSAFDDPLIPGTGTRSWQHTETQPLDAVFGAGELNVLNSYKIELGGRHAGSQSSPGAAAGTYGWDYQDFKSNPGAGDVNYQFVVPAGSTASELSIILSWNAKVVDSDPSPGIFSPAESLQDLNLELADGSGGFLGGDAILSASTVDNVEHIYLNNVPAGAYTLTVSGAAGWDYGVAWRMATAFNSPSADFDSNGVVDGEDLLTWQQNVGRLINATSAQGDANGDGAVDAADLAIARTQFGGPPPTLAAFERAIAGVPEPTAMILATILFLAAGVQSRRGAA